MNVFRSFDDIGFNKNTVLTAGTFDGVHQGHQHIITRLLEISSKEKLRNVLVTFEPHPQIVLQKPGRETVKLLTNIKERIFLFEKFGIENVLIIPFTYEFSQTKPDAFIEEYLVKDVGLSKILIGYDHVFGKNREGDEALLKNLGKKHNFKVEKISAFELEHASKNSNRKVPENEIIVSSTKIRNALKDKDLLLASEMLGYDYFVSGNVVHGFARGATIGYPTANIDISDKNKLLPPNGIYLVSSEIDGELHYGMANLGNRPTFEDDDNITLEVFYFDFSKDIYDYYLSVSFLKYMREEIKFPDVPSLIKRIELDEIECRQLISLK